MTAPPRTSLTTQELDERILTAEHRLMARDDRVLRQWGALGDRVRDRAAGIRHWIKPVAGGVAALAALWTLRRLRRGRPSSRQLATTVRTWWPRLLPIALTLSGLLRRGGLNPATAFGAALALGRTLFARRQTRHG